MCNERPVKAMRITVFVPQDHADSFVNTIQDEIPAFLGPYDRVLWQSAPKMENGMEQFRPLARSNPKEGHIGDTVKKPTVRIEFLVPDDRSLVEKIIQNVLKTAHPYNDPVIYYDKVSVA